MMNSPGYKTTEGLTTGALLAFIGKRILEGSPAITLPESLSFLAMAVACAAYCHGRSLVKAKQSSL